MNPEKRRKFEKKVISIIINNYYDNKIKEYSKKASNKRQIANKERTETVVNTDYDNFTDIIKSLNGEREEPLRYALNRTENCRHMETKTFCHNCKTPCYSKNMMEKITHIMKSEGKKMLLKHPLTAVEQVYYVMRSKRNGNVV